MPRFLLRQADVLFEGLLDGLAVALRRRSEGEAVRPALCCCGYAVRPDWNHDHGRPGIIVDWTAVLAG